MHDTAVCGMTVGCGLVSFWLKLNLMLGNRQDSRVGSTAGDVYVCHRSLLSHAVLQCLMLPHRYALERDPQLAHGNPDCSCKHSVIVSKQS